MDLDLSGYNSAEDSDFEGSDDDETETETDSDDGNSIEESHEEED